MKKLTKIASAIFFVFMLYACKKKTTIDVLAYNYALDEPMAGAKVALIEIDGNPASGNYSCKEIDVKVADKDGKCKFNRERLKTNKDFIYFVGIVEAYNLYTGYPCGHKETDIVKVGSTQEMIPKIYSYTCNINITIKDLFLPSLPSDSFFVSLILPSYQAPYDEKPRHPFVAFSSYFINTSASQKTHYFSDIKSNAGSYVLHVFKRKMGIISESITQIKAYPGENKTIVIDW